ncbi:MAG: hypothetical protein JWN04_338, partial [Myxococcaceae bacterium]|nr:hypothetical protein [Myxococcaceae bacterium]
AKTDESTRNFLHQYMTLTRCDLFFADAAILVEGTSERLLLPRMIKMIDAEIDTGKDSLGSRYLSTVEVGGAYAHIFFDLLTFLELKTLVITDIDTVKKTDDHEQRVACQVRHGQFTSNACIKQWFNDSDVRPTDLLAANENAKTIGYRRIAFQLPEEEGGPCGRSFEDAFMLANPSKYSFLNLSMEETERQAWKNAQSLKKSEFALELALNNEKWVCPRYIGEGLRWLAEHAVAAPVSTPVAVV